jgi:hypothetical protein
VSRNRFEEQLKPDFPLVMDTEPSLASALPLVGWGRFLFRLRRW